MKYAEKCCTVRAIVLLLVVIGDGLEPAANTLLLHVSLVLQQWSLFPGWRQQVLASCPAASLSADSSQTQPAEV